MRGPATIAIKLPSSISVGDPDLIKQRDENDKDGRWCYLLRSKVFKIASEVGKDCFGKLWQLPVSKAVRIQGGVMPRKGNDEHKKEHDSDDDKK